MTKGLINWRKRDRQAAGRDRRNETRSQSGPQQRIRTLTVGALGNEMAAPAIVVLAATSSAVSETSKIKTSASVGSGFPAISFVAMSFMASISSRGCASRPQRHLSGVSMGRSMRLYRLDLFLH